MNYSRFDYAEDLAVIFAKVVSSEQGLDSTEALRRLNSYGSNELTTLKRTSPLIRFLQQFNNVLIYALLISAVITIFLRHWVDCSVILGVVVLNAIFGFIQEGKAEQAIEAIRDMLAPHAEVMRDGRLVTIPARELVRGDVVALHSGDRVPADLRLFQVKGLQIDEAILTGESVEVSKSLEPVAEDAALGDRTNMAYSGTAVTLGKGLGVVVATGMETELGKIGKMLSSVSTAETPLSQQLNRFGRWLAAVITVAALVTFLVGVCFWHHPISQMFLAAVGIAVAAIPEGLPPLVTIILAIGVTRMARAHAIIRRLPAVETMGAVTVICTDKTGTLTKNEQQVRVIVTSKKRYLLNDEGRWTEDGKVLEAEQLSGLQLIEEAAILCNDASFFRTDEGEHYIISGNAVDRALLELGEMEAIDLKLLQQQQPRLDMIPYESLHKFMATLHHAHEGINTIYVKGAPEQLLARAVSERLGDLSLPLDTSYWQEQIELLAKQGYRILAVCCKEVAEDKVALNFADVMQDLVMIGLIALMDAPRAEVAPAIRECSGARIKVKMITGDHAVTAATVAEAVGIESKEGVLTGKDIDQMSDEELADAVNKINVYARTSPQHKLRLVKALQANGEVVAMTGDGVNDAPALKRADIGVAMGKKGAELAKESAEMVLADDNFATIVKAILEGRVVFDNLRKVLLHALPTNAAEGLVVMIAVFLGTVLPITPVQILWVNMVTSVSLATALGFEPAEPGVMHRPPRDVRSGLLSKVLINRGFLVVLLLMIAVFGLFTWECKLGVPLPVARTVAVNMLVMGEAAYLFNCRKLYAQIIGGTGFWQNPLFFVAIGTTIAIQLGFTYLPIMQKFFGTAALDLSQWGWIALGAITIFLLIEVEKWCSRRFMFRQFL